MFWILKIARYLLASLGGILVYEGYLDAEYLEQLTGSIIAAASILISIYQSYRRIKEGNQHV